MKKEMIIRWTFLFIAAAALLFFYIVAHPLYIYDVDDWTYITYSRHAVPSFNAWNPTKILPETIMPLSALIGVDVIMPFTGDYIHSLAVAFAIVIVLFVLVYLYFFGEATKKVFGLKEGPIFFLMASFLLLHFVVYKSTLSGTPHMLYGGNVNCHFNYLIPGLLNGTLVLWLMSNNVLVEKPEKKRNGIYTGMMILALYLALNSNLFHSIILASFAAVNLIRSFFMIFISRKNKAERKFTPNKVLGFIKQNVLWIGIIIVWLIAHLFEMNGGRAAMANNANPGFPIGETVKALISSLSGIKMTFLIIVFGLLGIALAIWLIGKRRESKAAEKNCLDRRLGTVLLMLFVSLLITLLYLILLCSKVSPRYISNPNVQFSFLFWIVSISIFCFGYIVAKYPKVVALLPLFVFVMLFETVVCSGKYADATYVDPATAKALDENIIDQAIKAEKDGFIDTEILIPAYLSQEWPMPVRYGGERIAYTLYKHGIIHANMKITLVPSESINTQFGLN